MNKIEVEMCRGCGRPLLTMRVANLVVRCEVEPMDAQMAATALLAGRELWEARPDRGLSGARPATLQALRGPNPPKVVGSHRCKAAGGPVPPVQASPVQPTPQSPPAGRTAPFSGPSAGPSSVRAADRPRSEGPRCDDCGLIMQDGDYVSAQLGDVYIWAQHLVNCGEGS